LGQILGCSIATCIFDENEDKSRAADALGQLVDGITNELSHEKNKQVWSDCSLLLFGKPSNLKPDVLSVQVEKLSRQFET
jgi:hypothetical protein